MKKNLFCAFSTLVLALGLTLAFTACGSDDKDDKPAPSKVIYVSEIVTDLGDHNLFTVGEEYQFHATAKPDEATDKTLTWSSDNPSVATVSQEGLVTAKAQGAATITVTATSGIKRSATITVSAESAPLFKEPVMQWGANIDKLRSMLDESKINDEDQPDENRYLIYYDEKDIINTAYEFYRGKLIIAKLTLDPEKFTYKSISDFLNANYIPESFGAKSRVEFEDFIEGYSSKDGKTFITFKDFCGDKIYYIITYYSKAYYDNDLFSEPSIKWGADIDYLRKYGSPATLKQDGKNFTGEIKIFYEIYTCTCTYMMNNAGKLKSTQLTFKSEEIEFKQLSDMMDSRYNRAKADGNDIIYLTADGTTSVHLYEKTAAGKVYYIINYEPVAE